MNMWKLSILALAGVSVAAISVGASGCTVTSSSGGVDAGDYNPDASSSDGAAHADTGSNDGGTEAATCAATTSCPAVNPNGFISDNCGACDNCIATNCCTETTNCYAPAADGGPSECAQLFTCYDDCDKADGGQSCLDACASALKGGVAPHDAVEQCATNSCKTQCGIP